MPTTETMTPDIADRIVLGMVASKSGDRGQVAFSTLRDSLFPHVSGDDLRASVGRLVAAGKIEITANDAYRFVVNPEFPQLDRDISAVIMAYAYGRGAGSTFDLADVLALPMIAHVAAGRITASLKRLVTDGHLNDSPAGWSIPAPTGPERELIERLAGWFGTLDATTSVTWEVIGSDFSSTPSYVLRTAIDYLTREGRITRVRAGTYMRAA